MSLRFAIVTALFLGLLVIGVHQSLRGGLAAGYPFLMFALGFAGLMIYIKGKEKDKEMKGERGAEQNAKRRKK